MITSYDATTGQYTMTMSSGANVAGTMSPSLFYANGTAANFVVGQAVNVRVRYLDRAGVEHDTVRRGLTAGTFQHECDHLDGVLYPMRIVDFSRFGFTDVLFPELVGQADD
jgi:hypothetical protein